MKCIPAMDSLCQRRIIQYNVNDEANESTMKFEPMILPKFATIHAIYEFMF